MSLGCSPTWEYLQTPQARVTLGLNVIRGAEVRPALRYPLMTSAKAPE